MRVLIVTPAPPKSRLGNRITALRWSRLLREAGHEVVITQRFDRQRCDALIALHALATTPWHAFAGCVRTHP